MLSHLPDNALLQSENEEMAFRVIYERYWQKLYQKARNRLGNAEDAQDVVQDIFVSFWRNRHSIVVEHSVSPYLFTALKFALIKVIYRKARKGVIVPLSIRDLDGGGENQHDNLRVKELQQLVRTEVLNLPPRMQEVYRMSRDEELQIREIAHRLNLSEQSVKNTLTSASKRIRAKIVRYSTLIFLVLLSSR